MAMTSWSKQGAQFNLAGKLTLRIESKAQLIQARMQRITSGYHYGSENGFTEPGRRSLQSM
jgi:hypothetical protein